jgi:methionine-rich copper-binding protein CopC
MATGTLGPMSTARLTRPGRLVSAVVGLAAMGGALAMASTASAHTELESSTPADGDAVDEPVSEITLVFSEAVTVVGDGFEVLDPAGTVITPTPRSDDATTFVLPFDPPLAGGDVGVRFTVTAQDGHVLEDSFSFTVTTAPATTAPATTAPATTAPATTAPATTAPASTTAPTTTPASTAAPTTPPTTAAPTTVATSMALAASPGDPDEGGSSTVLVIAIVLVAIAVAGGAVAVLRARSSSGP